MSNIVSNETENKTCEECVISLPKQELIANEDGSSTLRCVKCPFCKRIVDAHMTKTSISCPACKVTVDYAQ